MANVWVMVGIWVALFSVAGRAMGRTVTGITLTFHAYEPSAFEVAWAAEPRYDVCRDIAANATIAAFARRHAATVAAAAVPNTPQRRRCHRRAGGDDGALGEDVGSVYSAMVFRIHRTDERGRGEMGNLVKIPIDPLVGTLRHPKMCDEFHRLLKKRDVPGLNALPLDKGYLLINAWIAQRTRGRRLYFDVGGSTWDDGLGGASQKWFYELYDMELCAPLDSFYVWEAKPLPREKVFDRVPEEVRDRYHWYNIPASGERDDPHNPLTTLRRVAAPADYVVLKIDIDNWALELELIQQILDDSRLSSLIDELFFEHHTEHYPMSAYWGSTASGTLQSSIALFTALREKGIRAHPWV